MDTLLSTNADLGGAEMVALLKEEFVESSTVENAYRDCCGDYKPISNEIQRILEAIEELANSLDEEIIEDALKLESGIKEKCDEIKRHKMLIRKLIQPKFKVSVSTQVELKTRDKATEMAWMFRNAST